MSIKINNIINNQILIILFWLPVECKVMNIVLYYFIFAEILY